MSKASELRAALDKVKNTTGPDKARAASDAARLGIKTTREVTAEVSRGSDAETGRATGKTFSDRYEQDLRGRLRGA